MVLDQPVGLHHVRANLTPKRNVQFSFVQLVCFFLAFLDFQIVELGAQHFHRHFAVFALAALRLARNDHARRKMGDANGSFHFIDILAALTACAISINFQFVWLDVDLDAVIHFWNHKHGRKRSVPPCGLIKGRDANQTMNTSFSRKHAVSVLAGKLNGGIFDSGFFAFGFVQYHRFQAFALRPAQIHAEQNGRPIL